MFQNTMLVGSVRIDRPSSDQQTREHVMKRMLDRLPPLVIAAAACGLWLHGPIHQLEHYHEFADQRVWLGIAHAVDVLSNLGFAAVGLWGLYWLWPAQRHLRLANAWPGYRLFLTSLVLTAFGSTFYHLDPDNSRLVWDRLPIALACAGLLAGVYSDSRPEDGGRITGLLSIAAFLSVAWWYLTEQRGEGDLRPYLLLQALPLLLIPLWQAIYDAPRADRVAFGLAIALYAAAKVAELYDHELFDALGWVSGHTIKHLLSTGSAAVLAGRLVWRVRYPVSGAREPSPAGEQAPDRFSSSSSL
jgi:hypothetical protein